MIRWLIRFWLASPCKLSCQEMYVIRYGAKVPGIVIYTLRLSLLVIRVQPDADDCVLSHLVFPL